MNDVFADIFNVLVFAGQQVVTSESLEELTGISQYKAEDGLLHEQERDVVKRWNRQGVNLVIAGVENQTKPDRDMPFRCIGYDGASYRSQLLKKTEKTVRGRRKMVPVKERFPVVTIVLYFGEKEWKHPLDLKKSFRPQLPKNEVTQVLDEFLKLMRVLTGDNRYAA